MGRQEELTREELEAEAGEELPDREAMSIVDLGEVTMTGAPVPVDSMPPEDSTQPVPPEDETYPVDRAHHEPRPPAV